MAAQFLGAELVDTLRTAGDAEELCHSLGIQVEGGSLGLPDLQGLLREHYDASSRRLTADADVAAKTAASYLEDGRLNDALASANHALGMFPWHERLKGVAAAASAALVEDIEAQGLEEIAPPEEAPSSYAAPPPSYQVDQTEAAPAEFHVRLAALENTTEQIADSAMLGAFTAAESGPTENPTEAPSAAGLSRVASGEFRKAQIEAQVRDAHLAPLFDGRTFA